MIRVVLPAQLRSLASTGAEVVLPDDVEATQRGVIDSLEATYPPLRGTIRDPQTGRRRPFLRFFADEADISHQDPDEPLPPAVAAGIEPFIVLGAIAGG
jgi:molybdopterin synthase sulfur carrier subunit